MNKITKTSIKKTLKARGWTVFYMYVDDEDPQHFLCTAHDTYGSVFEVTVFGTLRRAKAQMLSSVCVHEAFSISNWFFESERV